MTNEDAKQEAIKKAFGANYELVKPFFKTKDFFIDSNLLSPLTIGLDFSNINLHWRGRWWRPSSIAGITNNNGWVRIQPDGSNLPKETGEYRWLFESGNMADFYYEPGDIMSVKTTHYKPITPELKPIY